MGWLAVGLPIVAGTLEFVLGVTVELAAAEEVVEGEGVPSVFGEGESIYWSLVSGEVHVGFGKVDNVHSTRRKSFPWAPYEVYISSPTSVKGQKLSYFGAGRMTNHKHDH